MSLQLESVDPDFFATLGYAFMTVWWASNISATLKNILSALNKIDTEFEKRDKQISKIWEKIDDHSKLLASQGNQIENMDNR